MRRFFIISAMLTIVAVSGQAQTPAEVLTKDMDITFFGLDFSKAKGVLLGATATEVVNKYMPAINQLLIKEAKKYNIAGAFNKTNLVYDFTDVTRLNAQTDTNFFTSTEPNLKYSLTEGDVLDMVQKYSLNDKSGIGLVFIVERIDKFNQIAVFRVVFFAMPGGRLILNQPVTGKPQGIGFRNYWANTVYDALKGDIKKLVKSYK